ncbi:putative ribonuclease H-like domain-containing protein [Tanacetum coccineum]
MSGEEPTPQMAPVESPQMMSTVKLSILKKVILNGDGPIQVITNENGVETEVHPKTAQTLLARQRERKAKIILLLAIPDEYQLRFHGIKDAKTLWAAIKKGLDKAYDRFQKLISLLEVHVFEADIKGSSRSSSNSQNVAFLSAEDTSNSNEVNTANGSNSLQLDDEDLEQIDHDDLKEMDLKWQVALLFMRVKRFYKKTGKKLNFNSKEPVGFDKTKVECFNCHRRGHFARECRAPRNQGSRNGDARYRSRDNTRRTVPMETSDALVIHDNALIVQDGLGYDWSYIAQDEPTEFALMAFTSSSSGSDTESTLEIVAYKLGLESIEAQLIVHQKNEVAYEEKIALLDFDVKDKSNAITRLKNNQLSAKDKAGLGYGDQINENDLNSNEVFNSVFDSRSSDGNDNQTNDRFKKVDGYHVVPPLLTGNYMPPLADLSFVGLDDSVYRPSANKTNASISKGEACVTQNSNISVEMPKVDSVRNEPVKSDKQAEKPRMITQNPKVDRKDWNGKMTQKLGLGFRLTKKACFVCGSYNHLIKDCDFHEKRMATTSVLKNLGKGTSHREVRPVWNNPQRINHQNKFVSSVVLTKFGRVPVNAARTVNTATHRNRVNISKSRTNTFHKSHSPIRRSFYKPTAPNTKISNEKVNAVRVNDVNTAGQTAVSVVKGNGVTAGLSRLCLETQND